VKRINEMSLAYKQAGVLWAAIEKKVPERYLQANRMAFDLGVEAVSK